MKKIMNIITIIIVIVIFIPPVYINTIGKIMAKNKMSEAIHDSVENVEFVFPDCVYTATSDICDAIYNPISETISLYYKDENMYQDIETVYSGWKANVSDEYSFSDHLYICKSIDGKDTSKEYYRLDFNIEKKGCVNAEQTSQIINDLIEKLYIKGYVVSFIDIVETNLDGTYRLTVKNSGNAISKNDIIDAFK